MWHDGCGSSWMQDVRATMQRMVRALGAWVLWLLFATQALATPITWKIVDARFDDGASVQGYLSFEWPGAGAVVAPLADFRLSVTGGNEALFPPIVYDPASVVLAQFIRDPADPVLPPEGEFLLLLDAANPFGRNRSLRIAPTLPLDGALNVVPLLTVADLPLPGGQGREECFNCVPFRVVVSGQFVSEPGTLILVFAALGLLGGTSLAHRQGRWFPSRSPNSAPFAVVTREA